MDCIKAMHHLLRFWAEDFKASKRETILGIEIDNKLNF